MDENPKSLMIEALGKVESIIAQVNQGQRLEALDKMPAILQALAPPPPPPPMPPVDLQGEGHTIIVNNNPGGNNDISFVKGGWVSRKTGTSKVRSGEFKVQ